MSDQVTHYKIFVSTTDGLKEEFSALCQKVSAYSDIEGKHIKLQFDVVFWKNEPPGYGERPQSVFNKELRECDYLILILWDRFGTPPDKDGKSRYKSGCEEEFYEAIKCYGDKPGDIHDIAVLFKEINEEEIENIDRKQINAVNKFREKLEESNKCIYKKFSSMQEFERIIWELLAKWRQKHEVLDRRKELSVTSTADGSEIDIDRT